MAHEEPHADLVERGVVGQKDVNENPSAESASAPPIIKPTTHRARDTSSGRPAQEHHCQRNRGDHGSLKGNGVPDPVWDRDLCAKIKSAREMLVVE